MFVPFLAGLLGGLLGPLIGVGGGVVIVPLLNFSGASFQSAVVASLFSIVVTSLTSIFNYRGLLNFRLLWKYVALSASVAVLSALASVKYSGEWVKLAYGVYLIVVGVVLLVEARPRRRAPVLGYLLIFAGGLASALFGVGGGTVFVPALVLAMGFDAKAAVASSMGIILPTAAASTLMYASLGVLDVALGAAVALGSFIGAFVASRYIMPRLKSQHIRKMFVGYVFAVGVYYLFSTSAILFSRP